MPSLSRSCPGGSSAGRNGSCIEWNSSSSVANTPKCGEKDFRCKLLGKVRDYLKARFLPGANDTTKVGITGDQRKNE